MTDEEYYHEPSWRIIMSQGQGIKQVLKYEDKDLAACILCKLQIALEECKDKEFVNQFKRGLTF